MGSGDSESSKQKSASQPKYQEIVVTNEGGARTILLNRPAKKNALNYQVSYSTGVYRWSGWMQRAGVTGQLQVLLCTDKT